MLVRWEGSSSWSGSENAPLTCLPRVGGSRGNRNSRCRTGIRVAGRGCWRRPGDPAAPPRSNGGQPALAGARSRAPSVRPRPRDVPGGNQGAAGQRRGVRVQFQRHPKEGRSSASRSGDAGTGELTSGTGQSLARPTRSAVSVPVTVTRWLIFSLSLLGETFMEGLPRGSSGPRVGPWWGEHPDPSLCPSWFSQGQNRDHV